MAETTQDLRLQWQPELRDYEEVSRVLLRLRRRSRAGALLLGSALVLVGLALLQRSVPAGVGAVLVVALLGAPGTHRLAARRLWRRDPHVHQPSSADLVPGHGLRLNRGDVASESRWSAWSGVLETDRLYLLRRRGGPPVLLVVAKRGVADADGAARLRAILTTEIGEPVRVGR